MNLKLLTEKLEEVSQIYTKEFEIERDSDWFVFKLQEELGELIQAYLMMIGQARRKGRSTHEIREEFEAETADVFAHVLILAKHFNVDLEKAVEKKWMKWRPADVK